jgi:hypothetical protein
MLTTYGIASAAAGRHFVAIVTTVLIALGAFTDVVGYVLSPHRKGRLRFGV